jgi:hypothetical protein
MVVNQKEPSFDLVKCEFLLKLSCELLLEVGSTFSLERSAQS